MQGVTTTASVFDLLSMKDRRRIAEVMRKLRVRVL